MTSGNLLLDIMVAVYKAIVESIILKYFLSQSLAIAFILFLLIAIGGIILGKIVAMLTRIIINLFELDRKFTEEYKEILFGHKPSYIYSLIFKWYIYILSLIYGIQTGIYYGYNMYLDFSYYYSLLNIALISVNIVVIGIIVSGFVERMIYNSNLSEIEKKYIGRTIRYLVIYIFIMYTGFWAGYDVSIMYLALKYFVISFSIGIGILIIILILLRYKDELYKIIKKE